MKYSMKNLPTAMRITWPLSNITNVIHNSYYATMPVSYYSISVSENVPALLPVL
jgi:hypothetical protein